MRSLMCRREMGFTGVCIKNVSNNFVSQQELLESIQGAMS